MLTSFQKLLLVFFSVAVCLAAENITGTVIVKRRLTRPSVTQSALVYQRGSAVALLSGRDPALDPLAYERSRVVVYLEGDAKPDAPGEASMRQIGRTFAPDLVVVQAGSKVVFPNMDPIFHNVFSLSNVKQFVLGNYPKGDSRTVMFGKPGIVYLNCRLHPNMAATIVVTPNRWNTKVDGEGEFCLRDVPPGKYTVVAWHKAAGFFRKTIEVPVGGDSSVGFFIPLEAEK